MEFNFENLKKNDLHHFNIIENGTVECVNDVCMQKLNFEFAGNNNYFYKKYNEVHHDEANEISHFLALKKSTDDKMIVVVECDSLNENAQNSLLKIFEETTSNKFIFLILPKINNLLPTLLSRAEVFVNNNNSKTIAGLDHETLKEMSIKDRLDLVNKIIAKHKNEKITKTNIEFSLSVLVKDALKDEENRQKIDQGAIKSLKQSHNLINHIQNNGSHIKSIMEFVVLNI